MSEINEINEINNTEINNEPKDKKKPKGRPRTIPDELRKPKREKRVVSDKVVEPREPSKKGRPVGTIHNPARHRPDGTYDNSPNDPEWSRKYYEQHAGDILECEICGNSCVRKNFLRQRSVFCRLAKLNKLVETFDQTA
jgi:hypothetical protein